MEQTEKPPLGLIPKEHWFRTVYYQRYKNILGAIRRFEDAEKPIPVEWEEEALELRYWLSLHRNCGAQFLEP